jgi:hypothetical protein
VLTILENVDDATNLAANKWMLTNTVEFGANGNAISVNANEALRFTPNDATTYAFVYTQTAADPAKDKEIFEAIGADDLATFTGKKYRYDYKATTAAPVYVNDNGTPNDDTDDTTVEYFDAQKGHVYFTKDASDIYARVNKPFIGQGAGNLYTRSGAGTTQDPYVYTKATTNYAVSGVTYYYTTNGQTYPEAHLVTYADNMLSSLYEATNDLTTYPTGYKETTDNALVDGKAYYFKNANNEYVYCVFLPQQVNGMFELDKEAAKVETTEAPVDGQTYFDKYNYNNAERFAKVIKVQ